MTTRDVNPTQGFNATDRQLDWHTEEAYWRNNWSNRPYASSDRGFDYYRPAYRFGSEAAIRYSGRQFSDVEGDLHVGWDRYEDRGRSTWENVRDAVRDGWNRVTNR